MPSTLASIIREIYRQAKDVDIQPPNATRLVKLVYLADIEWRKTHSGEPLSDLHWRFHYYGPYANEFSAILGSDDVEVSELVDGKTVKRVHFDAEDLARPEVPENVSAIIRRVVKEWGDTHINTLLNHVYFETEPMENVKRGEMLDFSKLRVVKPLTVKLDPVRLKQLRGEMDQHVARLNLTREGIHYAALDLDSEHAWDDEDASIRLPVGTIVAT